MEQNKFRFGTVGSPISTPKKPGGSVGAIRQLHCLGLDAMELGWVQSVRVSEETCALINAESKNSEVLVSIHAPYYINLNADEEEWPKSRKRLMDAAYYGWKAGATDIIFHPGSYFEQPADVVLQTALPRLADCVNELVKLGVEVVLRPETMGKSAMLGSLQDTLEMGKSISGVLPCLDFAHLHARTGDGSMNSPAEWSKALDLYAEYLGEDSLQKLHIHLSGIEYGPKGEKEHLPLQESDLNMIGLFETLHKYHCAGRILCESPIMEEDALYMQKTWNSITE